MAGETTRIVGIVVDGRPARDGANVVQRSLKDIDDAAQRTEARVQQFGSALTALKGILAGIGVASLVREFVDAGLAMQSVMNTLKAVTGNASLAGVEMGFLRAEANRLGLDLKSSSEAYAGLAAAAKDTSLEGDKARQIFVAVSEAMTVTGKTSEQTKGALLALQQMISKGTVQSEELKGQLGERLVSAFQDAAKAMGVTTAELGKLLEKGQVFAEDFLPKLAKVLHDKWGAAALEAAKGLQANLNRMKTAITDFGDTVLKSGFGDALNAAITSLLKVDGVNAFAVAIGQGLGGAVNGLMGAFAVLTQHIDLAYAALTLFAGARAVTMIAALTTGMWGLVAAAAAFAFTPIGAIATALGLAAAAVVYFREKLVEVGGRMATVWDYVVTAGRGIASLFVEIGDDGVDTADKMGRAFTEGAGDILTAMTGATVGVLKALDTLIAAFFGVYRGMAAVVTEFGGIFSAAWDGMITRAGAKIVGMGEAFSLALSGNFSEAWSRLDAAMKIAPLSAVEAIPERLRDAMAEGFKSAAGMQPLQDAANGLVESINGIFERLGEAASKRFLDRFFEGLQQNFQLEAANLVAQIIPKAPPAYKQPPGKNDGKGIESYYAQQTAALTKQLETYLQLDDAAENYFETVKRGGKGLTQSQAEELAALQKTINAFKALDKAGKALQSATEAIRKDVYSGAANDLAKLIKAQDAMPAALARAREELDKAKVGTDAYAKAQQKLTELTDAYGHSGEAYAQGLKNLNAELDKGVTALRENVEEAEHKNKVLALEADGSDEARKALEQLTRQRALDLVQQEREKSLAPLREQLRQAELDGYGDIADALDKTIRKYDELYDRKAQADVKAVDLERLKADAQEAQQAFQEPFREAARSIQSTFADTFEQIFRGRIQDAKDFGKAFLDIFVKLAAQIAALLVFKPVVGGILGGLGVSDSFQRSLGILPSSGGGGTSAGGGVNLPGMNGLGNSILGPGFNTWLNTPLFTVGGTTPAAVTASGASIGEIGGLTGTSGFGQAGFSFSPANGLGLLGAGASIYGAIQNPNIASIAGAGATTAGAIMGMIPSLAGFGPWGMAAGAVLSLIGSFIKKKPSNLGAEYSFNLDDAFSTSFEGTKHPDQMAWAKSFAEPLQTLITNAETRFGVARRSDATIGTTTGRAEGQAFFYDKGSRDGGIENRQVFDFKAGDDASTQAALDSLLVAFLKDADWTGIGARMGETVARDVSTALENSSATTLDALMADLDFAEQFQGFIDLSAADLDPVGLAMRKIGEDGRAAAQQIGTAADSFRQKASDLGLGTETMADGLTRADHATQGYILSILGIEAPLDGVAAATQRATEFTDELRPILEAAGFSTERVGEIISTVFDNMVADAEAAAAAIRQANIAAAIDIRTSIEQAINPAYQMSAADLFRQQGLDFQTTGTTGGYGRLFALVSQAAGGSADALRQVGERLIVNHDAGYLTDSQVQAIQGYANAAYTRFAAPVAGGYQPANDNGSGTSTSGGSSGGGSDSGDGGAKKAVQDTIKARQDELKAINDTINALERQRDSYLDIAESTRKFRESLLTSDLSSLTPAQKLAEARTQFEATYAKAIAGDQDAMKDLQGASTSLLTLSKAYWASDVHFQQDQTRVQDALKAVEQKARDHAADAVAQLITLNATAASIELAIGTLQDELEGLSGGGSSGNGGGGGGGGSGGGGGGTTPTPPAAGFYLNQAGQLTAIRFGRESLGRTANEDIATFMPRMFKSYTGALTEDAAYAWMQEAHPSGLKGLSRLEYFAAAKRGGFPGTFGGQDHLNWLNADTTGGNWRSFIDRLRDYAEVPVGFWKDVGGPANYAMGGLVTGGVPGIDSVPAMLMPGERVFSAPHSRIIERLALNAGAGSGEAERLLGQVLERLESLERTTERWGRVDAEQQARIGEAQLKAQAENTAAVRQAKPKAVDPGYRSRVA